MTNTPITGQQLDEIEARAARLYERTASIDPNAHPDFGQLTDADVPALVAEVRRLRDELAEAQAENAKLIRWHREDETAFGKMRATIVRLRAELAIVQSEEASA